MKTQVVVEITTKILDAATGRVVKSNKPVRNLVFDQGLSALARSTFQSLQCTPASGTGFCQIGSGSNPNAIGGGAVLFTQATNQLAASAPFFTVGMVGAIFKYGTGTGGVEVYITGFTSNILVTVSASATVATPTAGKVWFVAQTALQSISFQSNNYETLGGDNGTVFAGNTATQKRTYIFGQQSIAYPVNEIGWNPTNNANRCLGRVVLPTTDNVGPSNIYIVSISLIVTYLPSAPAAVVNFGTGSINTAGNAMVEWFSVETINADGTVNTSGQILLDGSHQCGLYFMTATYTQNSAINNTRTPTATLLTIPGNATWTYVAASVGIMQISFSGTTTTTGQTVYGMCLSDASGGGNVPALDVKFTTPQTLPTGAFQPLTVCQAQYVRNLDNSLVN